MRALCVLLFLGVTFCGADSTYSSTDRKLLPEAIAATHASGVGLRTGRIIRQELIAEELDARQPVDFALKLRNYEELQARIGKGDVLSVAELSARYLPTRETWAKVARWAKSHGLTVRDEDSSRMTVFSHAPVSQVQAALQMKFARVAGNDGKEYTSAVSAPSLPAEIADSVAGLLKLSPHIRPMSAGQNVPVTTIDNFAVSPVTLARFYNAYGLGFDGTGETIVILGGSKVSPDDLAAFWQKCGLPTTLAQYSEVDPGSPPQGISIEHTMDLEMASAMAPKAKLVYLTSSEAQEVAGWLLNRAQTDHTIHQISASMVTWADNGTRPGGSTVDSQYFVAMAAIGVTMFASSGDFGSNVPSLGGINYGGPSAPLGPGYPASDPYVTAVGGTTVFFNQDPGSLGLPIAEGGWTLPYSDPSRNISWPASTGGLSEMFARPPWQTGPNIPAGAMRCVPDVAAYAFDPYFRLFCYYDGRDAGANGTSSASPIWAGLCALINQARAQAGLGPVGLLGPKIYPLNGTSAFNQITTGLMLDANSTFVLSEGATNGAYSVGPNYNMVTGLGSPNIGNLIAALTLPPAGAGSAPAITTQPQSQTCAQGATATFSATATGAPVPAYQWYFTIPGSVLDTLCADGLQSDGSTFSGSSTSSLTITNVRWHEILTVLARNANGAIASIPASLNISTFVPTLAWGSPAPIAVGTPLSSIQLNATSSVSGTFTYSPPVGTLLPVGVQTLSVAFTPTNTTTYSGATLTQTLTVQFPAALASDVLPSRFTAGWNAVAGAADYHLNVCTNSALTRFVPGYQNLEVGSATAVDVTGLTPGVTYYYQVFAYDSSGMTIGTSTIIPVTTSNAISISTPLIVSTLAGRVLLPGNADGTGPNAEFNDPLGVGLTASDGNLYVVDSGNNAIRQIQISTGTVSSFLGQSAHLKNPTGITSDSSGNVYVADTLNHVVRKVTASGVVSTLAGNVGAAGSSDGIGTGAAFNAPQGIAADAAGNLYVADTNNQTIRRIVAATGSVSTIAGNVGTIGHTDGTGTGALFNYPSGVAVDSSGNVFVADTENSTIRSLTNGGVVTTVAGIATSSGCADGIGTAAQFNSPSAIALDTSSGNLYVADTENFTIRMVVPSSRVVTTLAGTVGTSGSADGSGSAALFYRPSGITTDGAGNIYIADTNNQTIRLGILKLPPTIETQPQSQTATAGSNASFSVTATGRPTPTCQWNFNGSAIGGATGSSYSIASAQLSNAGIYTVTLTNAMGSVTSTAATLTVNAGPPPPGGSSSSGGGGGAASPWFLVALAIVAVARFRTYNLLWRARAVVPIGADH